MTTTEALCYGLARRYDPFMVNNVTGFIGPETHLDNFEMVSRTSRIISWASCSACPWGWPPAIPSTRKFC